MRRFTFRLERVRRLRFLALREAETALARAHARVKGLREKLEELEGRAHRAGREFVAELERKASVSGEFASRTAAYIASLHASARLQREALATALDDLAGRQRDFLERKRAHEVLQKLKDKKRREWIADVEREEQIQLDELHRSLAGYRKETRWT